VELSRKLIMSGLLGLVGRGSIGQVVLAVVLAFIFFAIALKHQPFTSGRLNFLKICSEAQLFGVLVLCLVIQAVEIGPVGLSAETITTDGYGIIMMVVTAVAVPIALGSICLLARDVSESRKADATDALAHGTAVEDARPDAAEEARQADLRPETFEQEFVVAGAHRAAPTRPIPARPTAQPQQVRPHTPSVLYSCTVVGQHPSLTLASVLDIHPPRRLQRTGSRSTARSTAASTGLTQTPSKRPGTDLLISAPRSPRSPRDPRRTQATTVIRTV
jgi:hypothetical protein